jgi:hypothetical protein
MPFPMVVGRMEKGIDWSGNMSNHFDACSLKGYIPIFYLKSYFRYVQILVVEKNNLIYNHKPIQNITQTHEPTLVLFKLVFPTNFGIFAMQLGHAY